ncbi:hypothetical protein R0135_13315 [Congregibacter variabilis]|uniref:Uncharacterized protein n=1 Tax=Congregibacter variabilis TaxID=3081200 RepID=A0ABZ0HZR3_9GAMM|nr:hypothetical protein R0135_13315 [Congregibacter sp. IMCC43200]
MQGSTSVRDRFFFYYALVLLAIVLGGFAPSFFARFAFAQESMPFYLHLHGAVLTGWFVLLVTQALLVRNANTALHRQLGRFFVAYGVVVVVGGLMATLNFVPRELGHGTTFDMDMAEVNPQQAVGIPFLSFATTVVWINIGSVVGFALLLALAVFSRKKADAHKRFMLFASASIISPALARISRMVFDTEQGPMIPLGLLLLMLAIVIHDYWQQKKPHRATLVSIGIVVALHAIAGVIAISPLGRAFVKSLA